MQYSSAESRGFPTPQHAITILHAAETVKGGVATVMRQLIASQSSSSDVASVRCLVPLQHVGELTPVNAQLIESYNRSGRNVASLVRFARSFARLILRDRPDVIHLHSTFAGLIGRVVLASMRGFYRPKVVYCPHAFSFLMNTSKVNRTIYAFIERLLSRVTDKIICVSEHEFGIAIQQGLAENKLIVVRNGVQAKASLSEKTSAQKSREIQLLYVGRFDRQKGFDVLLDAMAQLEGEPFHLTVAGGSVNDSIVPPERPNITYAGWLDAHAMSTVFGLVDVVIVPSRWEGFAMVPLEAMSHGLPVIASNCSSLPEVITEGVNGLLFPVEDSHALANCIRSRNAAEWAAMGRNGYRMLKSNFSDAEMTQSTMRIYRQLTSNTGRPVQIDAEEHH